MKRRLILCGIAAVALAASPGQADVTGSTAASGGAPLALTPGETAHTGTLGDPSSPVGNILGGGIFSDSTTGAAKPPGTTGNYLVAGPTQGQPSTLTFAGAGVSFLSFLWGSPDTYNVLTVNSTTGPAETFTAASLGFPVIDGNQSVGQYVQFAGVGMDLITSLVFSNSESSDAFEVSNFSTTPVPEPATWAMMLLGFGGIGYSMRRRRKPVMAQIA